MKKIITILLSIITIASICACGSSQKPVSSNMVINKSLFSEETNEVLKILDNEIKFWDYEIDDTIKAMSIDIWTYDNGEWINSGNISGNIEPGEHRIAVGINDYSYDIFDINGGNFTKSSYESTVNFSLASMTTETLLTNPTDIETNKEILLMIKLGADKASIETNITENFRDSVCDLGLAVTITFLDKNID